MTLARVYQNQGAVKHGRGNGCVTPDLSVMRDPPRILTVYLIKMASECESELNIEEEMSNVSVHILQNLNWIWSQKGRQLFHKVLQIVRLSLARFFREGKYAISRENLANESLRNCDVRQVLCILTIFCRFKPKNVCILPKSWSFQLFQSKIIVVKCCKEVIVSLELVFFRIFRV